MGEVEMTENERYLSALHAMQTGVAVQMEKGARETQPKHLRAGINSAMCDHAALVRLLLDKQFMTMAEYETAVADEMEREVARYEELMPPGVKLA